MTTKTSKTYVLNYNPLKVYEFDWQDLEFLVYVTQNHIDIKDIDVAFKSWNAAKQLLISIDRNKWIEYNVNKLLDAETIISEEDEL